MAEVPCCSVCGPVFLIMEQPLAPPTTSPRARHVVAFVFCSLHCVCRVEYMELALAGTVAQHTQVVTGILLYNAFHMRPEKLRRRCLLLLYERRLPKADNFKLIINASCGVSHRINAKGGACAQAPSRTAFAACQFVALHTVFFDQTYVSCDVGLEMAGIMPPFICTNAPSGQILLSTHLQPFLGDIVS